MLIWNSVGLKSWNCQIGVVQYHLFKYQKQSQLAKSAVVAKKNEMQGVFVFL